MITVVVYGQRPERMASLTASVLCSYGAVQLKLCDSITAVGEGSVQFEVDAVCRLERLLLPHTVLLLCDQSAPRRLEMGENTIVVTGSDNRRMVRLLKGQENPVVTCGTGVRDTLTLSSSSGEQAILCAQRRIPTASGTWLEPFEFAAAINRCDMRSALLAAGTAAVCGCDLTAGTINIDRQRFRV